MTTLQKFFLVLARLSFGWLFFYSGITKILDPAWSAAGFLKGAKTFDVFYQFLASPSLISVVNAVNAWGQLLLGISLLLGIGVRFSASLGALLMLLYYFPGLEFPYVAHGFLVDEHIIYASVLLFFAAIGAGRVFGLERWCASLPLCAKFPKLRALFG